MEKKLFHVVLQGPSINMKHGKFMDIDTCTIEHTAKTGQTWLIQIQADLLGESFSDSQITKP